MEDDITEPRKERYKVGEKRKGEESTEAARSTKNNQEGKRGEPRSEKKWCKKCHYKKCHDAVGGAGGDAVWRRRPKASV